MAAHAAKWVAACAPARAQRAPVRKQSDALASRYTDLLQSGVLTRRGAQRQFTHEVWERIAPGSGRAMIACKRNAPAT